MCKVYGIYNPFNDALIYVGKTDGCIYHRLYNHIMLSKTGHLPIHKGIRKIMKMGMLPIIKIIEVADTETKHIRANHKNGHLLNVNMVERTMYNTDYIAEQVQSGLTRYDVSVMFTGGGFCGTKKNIKDIIRVLKRDHRERIKFIKSLKHK